MGSWILTFLKTSLKNKHKKPTNKTKNQTHPTHQNPTKPTKKLNQTKNHQPHLFPFGTFWISVIMMTELNLQLSQFLLLGTES